MNMDITNTILDFAYQNGVGANEVEKIASTKDGDVFALSLVDANGFPLPVGLPNIVILKEDKLTLVSGSEALGLIERLENE